MTIKNVNAKIFDPNNEDFLADVSLEISLISSPNEDGKPNYEVKATFQGIRGEFSDKNFILEIRPSLRGFAFFTTDAIMGAFTTYKIVLQDSVWRNIDWFNNL